VTGSGNVNFLNPTGASTFGGVDASAATGDVYITANASTTTNDVVLGSGADTVDFANSFTSKLDTGAGDDIVTITNGQVFGTGINTGSGNDVVTLAGTATMFAPVNLGTGDDTIYVGTNTKVSSIDGGDGNDQLIVPDGSVVTPDGESSFTYNSAVHSPSDLGPFGSVTLPGGDSFTYSNFVCFVAGTRIQTDRGEVPVEHLTAGDQLALLDGGYATLCWSVSRRLGRSDLERNPNLRPIRISAGALGSGRPTRDLYVSRQHRMLIRSRIAKRMFGTEDVLVPAVRLLDLAGVDVDLDCYDVKYFHLLCEKHEIILAEGAAAESLFVGVQTSKALPQALWDELDALFPNLRASASLSRMVPPAKQQKRMLSRHLKHRLALFS
jgi:hypothetical protein